MSAGLDFLRQEIPTAWDWLENVVSDVTDEQANWWPPGTANSIGATYLHVVINPDVEIHRLLSADQPIIESGWTDDIRRVISYDPERFDDWLRDVNVPWTQLHDYGRAVQAWLVGTLQSVTEADLARPVNMNQAGLGWWTGWDLYALHGWRHVYQHGGEIACLKGLQGAKGYTAGFDAR